MTPSPHSPTHPTLRLDPRYPLLWRSPTSLQLGVDAPPARFGNVTIAEERMLAALTVGATSAGLGVIGANSGLTKTQVARFHTAVRPALLTEEPVSTARRTVVVSGSGPTADRLVWRLREGGLDPRPTGESPDDAVAAPALGEAPLAVVVGHYVLDPAFSGLWLRRDVPHLPVVYGDTSVRIGPLVEPGSGPCLHCLERHRADADPAWPAIAAQLWGLRSTAETPFLASEAATAAARIALNRLAGLPTPVSAPSPASSSITIDAVTGAIERRTHVPHPECSCGGIAGSTVSEPARRGTATGRSPRSAGRPRPTTTGAGLSVPA